MVVFLMTSHFEEHEEKFSWNEVNLLRGLIFKALEKDPDDYTRADLINSLNKLDSRRIELQKEMNNL